MNRLLILDGNAILHRAYHAIPPLTTPDGTIINAVYGFISMLLKLKTDLTPTYVAVAFDRPAPTFRKQLFQNYQASRPEMEENLSKQVDIIHEVIASMGIPIFEKDGFEADDVIGTIVYQLSALSSQPSAIIDQVIIVTGDRDILQLVEDEKVLVYMPVKGLTEAKLYGEKDVVERLGVDPKHIVDWKALAGDSSDNYPGVAGIGPKTAVQLINTYHSIEAVYAALHNGTITGVSENVKTKLLAGEESAKLGKILATIRTDAPLTIDWKALHVLSFDTAEAQKLFHRLGFSTLLKRLMGEPVTRKDKQPKQDQKGQKDQKDQSEQLSLV